MDVYVYIINAPGQGVRDDQKLGPNFPVEIDHCPSQDRGHTLIILHQHSHAKQCLVSHPP